MRQTDLYAEIECKNALSRVSTLVYHLRVCPGTKWSDQVLSCVDLAFLPVVALLDTMPAESNVGNLPRTGS